MTKHDFDNIIEFAQEREREAVKFYIELQDKVKFAAQKEMLKELEMMELGHVTMLENIKQEGSEHIATKEVKSLQISDYIVAVEPSAGMSYQDILIVAMKREEASTRLYTDMAIRFAGTETEKLFARLAGEESEHKIRFERLYDEQILKDN